MKQNWFIAAIVVGIVAIVIAAVAMRLSDDDSNAMGARVAAAPTSTHS